MHRAIIHYNNTSRTYSIITSAHQYYHELVNIVFASSLVESTSAKASSVSKLSYENASISAKASLLLLGSLKGISRFRYITLVTVDAGGGGAMVELATLPSSLTLSPTGVEGGRSCKVIVCVLASTNQVALSGST